MPSEAFMKEVMSKPYGLKGEPLVPEPQSAVAEPEEEEEEESGYAAGEETADDDQEEVADEADEDEVEDEQGETDEETETAHEDAPVYDGAWNDYFGSPEEAFAALQEAQENLRVAQQRERDTRQWGQQNSRERAEAQRALEELQREQAELREALAYQSGRVEASAGGADFEEWATAQIEENPQGAFQALHQQAMETGDFRWAYAFTELWAEEDPFRAARASNMLDMQTATIRLNQQRQQEQQPQEEVTPVAQVVGDVLSDLRMSYPDLEDGSEVLGGTIQIMSRDPQLHSALRSQNPALVAMAITEARSQWIASQRRNGRPRLSRGAQREVAAQRTRATVSRGDGQPPPTRTPADDVPPEMQGAMEHFAKWGMIREE